MIEKLQRWWDNFTEEMFPVLWMFLFILYGVYVTSLCVQKWVDTHPLQQQEEPDNTWLP